MCKLPYGESDYAKLRKKGFVYVDKTMYIEKLENDKSFIHFLRPRRFGKSLFTSMLGCYYDIALKDEFDTLFKGTYIHEHPTKEKNDYYILNFNFAGFSGREGRELEDEFNDKVREALIGCIEKYDFPIKVRENVSAARMLSRFISEMQHKDRKSDFYVIIDEYDHFANDLLSFHFDEFTNVMGSDGYVRAFYEELKNGTQMGIDRIFVTGVSPISLDSMTSGYTLCANGCNISTNLSLDPRFNEMMGFTSEEMNYLISLVNGVDDEEQILKKMRQVVRRAKQIYDGYMFSRDGAYHLFNPNMSLYYLDHLQSFQKPPLEIVDPNIYSDYKKLENLLTIQPNPEQREALEEILSGNEVLVNLTSSFELSKRFTKSDFISLLYYLGYLTISGTRGMRVKLSVPNEVIRNVYFDYFKEMLSKELHINTEGYVDAIDNILYDKDNTLFVKQMEEILHSLDNRDYMGMHEKETKIAAMAIAKANASILVKSEYPVPEGYIDLVFFPYQTEGATALIELKYIQKKDFTEELLKEKREEAYAQLVKYKQAKEFQNIDLVKWILIFCKDKCVLNEELD